MNSSDAPRFPLVLTTETPQYRRQRWFTAVFFTVLWLAPALSLPFTMARPIAREALASLAALEVLLLLFGMAATLLPFWYRGTWTLDPTGITCKPFLGQPRSLRWGTIERVGCPRGQATTFVGDGTRITIPWHQLPKEIRDQAHTLIEKALGKDFNLAHKPIDQPDPIFLRDGPWLERTLGFLKLLAAGVLIGAAWVAVVAAIAIGLDRHPLGFWLGMVWLYFPLLLVALWAWRSDRRRKQINPTWRHRRLD